MSFGNLILLPRHMYIINYLFTQSKYVPIKMYYYNCNCYYFAQPQNRFFCYHHVMPRLPDYVSPKQKICKHIPYFDLLFQVNVVKQDFKSLYLGSHDKALISGSSSSSSSSPSSSGKKRPGSSSTKGSKDRKVLDGITSFSSVAPDARGTYDAATEISFYE